MQKNAKTALFAIPLLAIVIQLIPVPLTNPPTVKTIDAPDAVKNILRKSCFDCHSHQTQYPWYSKVAPVSWLIYRDVTEGRKKLDFSAWTYDDEMKKKKFRKIKEEVIIESGMPLWFYVVMHPEAKVSDEEKAILKEWINAQTSDNH